MGHHHHHFHFHVEHVFHDVVHVASEVGHIVGGVAGEAIETVAEGASAVEDFKDHHYIQGAFAGEKALSGGAELLGLL